MESSERDVESELLEQLQELHRQLAEVGTAALAWPAQAYDEARRGRQRERSFTLCLGVVFE